MQTKQVIRQCPVYLSFLMGYMMSCNRVPNREILNFIPGTYVRSIDHEFATGKDTLIITPLEGAMYQIVKRSGFRRIHNGKELPYEHKKETWSGQYDVKTGYIQELQNGKVISFNLDKDQLLLGGVTYNKVR